MCRILKKENCQLDSRKNLILEIGTVTAGEYMKMRQKGHVNSGCCGNLESHPKWYLFEDKTRQICCKNRRKCMMVKEKCFDVTVICQCLCKILLL